MLDNRQMKFERVEVCCLEAKRVSKLWRVCLNFNKTYNKAQRAFKYKPMIPVKWSRKLDYYIIII